MDLDSSADMFPSNLLFAFTRRFSSKITKRFIRKTTKPFTRGAYQGRQATAFFLFALLYAFSGKYI
jgi:hypothetical protein